MGSRSRYDTLRAERVDAMRVLEATYDLEASEDAWLGGVLDAFKPAIDGGQGAVAYTYRFEGRAITLTTLVGHGAPEGWEVAARAAAASGLPQILSLYRSGPCNTVAEFMGPALWEQPVYKTSMKPLGAVDLIGCNAADPEDRGVLIGAAHGREIRVPDPVRLLLSRLVAHIAAAHRVRRRLVDGELDADEAICELSGEVVHAEEPAKSREARAALRAAIVAIDRARRRSRKSDAGDPMARWTALVRERWTLVDRFERDGRHYLVAKRNDPRVPRPVALSAAERQVAACAALGHSNKLIAYELGMTEAAVAARLSRAAKKLGVRSRVELVRVILAAMSSGDA